MKQGLWEGAQRAAALAREPGLDAQPLVVADEPEITVAETVLCVASERDAQAIVLGANQHGPIIGGTLRVCTRRCAPGRRRAGAGTA